MTRKHTLLASASSFVFITAFAIAQRPGISEDRELKEIDLSSWDCLERLEGTAKTPDGLERNRLKNRSAVELAGAPLEAMDAAAFVREMSGFDGQTRGKRRKDLSPAQKAQLDQREKQTVSLIGYLVLAYAGPPESTNCGSTDFHDWHLEIFEKPADHPPRVGDPTPIICEITPRTQNAIFQAGIRLQSLAAFIRAPDLSYEPTGHPASRIRVTGQLLWDDDHNGAADVGATIKTVGANKYHNPWRKSAWEIHPISKIELLDGGLSRPDNGPENSASTTPPPVPVATPPAPTAEQFITLLRPVPIKIPYGETVLPRGMKLPVLSRHGSSVIVKYLGQSQSIPVDSTDLQP